jgi:zeaxanthin glucosyltransferase
MARIAICISPLAGPINASRKLAKDLKANGHEVFYVGIPDCERLVASMNMPFAPVFESWFPKRSTGPRMVANGAPPRKRRSRRKDPAMQFFRAVIAGQVTSFDEVLENWKPDLLLLPSCFRNSTMFALMGHRAGVPSVYVTSIFLRFADPHAAPFSSDYAPAGTLGSAARVSLEWLRASALDGARQMFFQVVYGMNLRSFTNKLADACGYPRELIVWRDLFAPRILAPDLVLYPQCLDLPGGERPGRVYASASIDLDRQEPSFPWHRLRADVPLILCAMGTVRYTAPERMRTFLEAVIRAAEQIRPEHQFVIATGGADPASFANVPGNVILVENAPQLGLLARASLMITHGGANSMKECAYFGVPVIVFPLAFDQHATAARVKFHGLGLVGRLRDATANNIQTMAEKALRTAYFRTQAAWMRDRMREADGRDIEIRAIENALPVQSTDLLQRKEPIYERPR